VDENTLLGRYYLIFMLCLKPERVIDTINSYCDYSFIPEMCPSGDEAVMGDSDDFFMLELQDREKETHMLRLGKQSEPAIARSLQEWTTAEHRRAAAYDIVFHSRDIPPQINAAKAEARAFVERIGKRLRRPIAHAIHPYWIGGVEAWKEYQRARNPSAWPRELAPLPRQSGVRGILFRTKRALGRKRRSLVTHIFGRPPLVTRLNPNFLDFEVLRHTVADMFTEPGTCALVVRDRPDLVDPLIVPHSDVDFATLTEILSAAPDSIERGTRGYTRVLIYLLRKNCRHAQEVVERCQAMAPEAVCNLVVHDLYSEACHGTFAEELPMQFQAIFGWPPRIAALSIVGGRLKRLNHRVFNYISYRYARFGIFALPLIAPAVAIGLPLILLVNTYLRHKPPSRRFDGFCSSVAIRMLRAAARSEKVQPISSALEGWPPFGDNDARVHAEDPSRKPETATLKQTLELQRQTQSLHPHTDLTRSKHFY
jgi:hypothetical protein